MYNVLCSWFYVLLLPVTSSVAVGLPFSVGVDMPNGKRTIFSTCAPSKALGQRIPAAVNINTTENISIEYILYIDIIDLEKAYDRVPREEIWRTMRERLVPEKYVKLVQDMYTGCRTKVRTVAGESSKFNVEVGLHQGSALSPYLFLILMDVSSELSSLNPQFRQISVPFCSTRDVTVRRPRKFRYRPPGGATICRVWSPGVASRRRDVTRRL